MPKVIEYLSAFDSFTFKENGLTFKEVRLCNEGANFFYKRQPSLCIDYVRYLLIKSYLGSSEEFENFFEKTKDVLTKGIIPLEDNLSYLIGYGKNKCEEEDFRFAKMLKDYGDCSWKVNGSPACALFIQEQTASYLFETIKGAE